MSDDDCNAKLAKLEADADYIAKLLADGKREEGCA